MDVREGLTDIKGQISWISDELQRLQKISDAEGSDVINKTRNSLGIALIYLEKYLNI